MSPGYSAGGQSESTSGLAWISRQDETSGRRSRRGPGYREIWTARCGPVSGLQQRYGQRFLGATAIAVRPDTVAGHAGAVGDDRCQGPVGEVRPGAVVAGNARGEGTISHQRLVGRPSERLSTVMRAVAASQQAEAVGKR